MVEWPTPKTIRALFCFLWLIRHCHCFIQDYVKIASQLGNLLKKDGFWWSNQAEEAFWASKSAMTTTLVLAHPDFSIPFELEYNATGNRIRAVLMQKGKPIGFYSHIPSGLPRGLLTYEKEMLAIARSSFY